MLNAAQEGLEILAKTAEMGGIRHTYYRKWLQKGQPYTLGTLTPDEQRYLDKLIARVGGWNALQPKQCFMNSQRIIGEDREERFRYVEGWWVNPSQPVLVTSHAWLSIGGKAIDLTHDALKRKHPDFADYHYWGLELDRDTVLLNMVSTERYTGVLDNRENLHKFLGK